MHYNTKALARLLNHQLSQRWNCGCSEAQAKAREGLRATLNGVHLVQAPLETARYFNIQTACQSYCIKMKQRPSLLHHQTTQQEVRREAWQIYLAIFHL